MPIFSPKPLKLKLSRFALPAYLMIALLTTTAASPSPFHNNAYYTPPTYAAPSIIAPHATNPPQKQKIIFEVSNLFINILGDVPLMTGLNVDYDSVLIFDKPEGRFIELIAVMDQKTNPHDVQSYYQRSLPMLGWQKIATRHYQREQDILTFSFKQNENNWITEFILKPTPHRR